MSVKTSAVNRMSPGEACKYVADCGLGFGIDATSPSPWKNKLAYRVCHIGEGKDDVVIVDEGGSWESFYHKVESQNELQGKLSSAVSTPDSPVSIAAGVEISRRKVRSREVFGRRLVECKASICPESFTLSASVDAHDFEARLSSWIVDRIRYLADAWKISSQKLSRAEQGISLEDMDELGLTKTYLKLAKKAAEHKSVKCDQVKSPNCPPAPTAAVQEEAATDAPSNAEHILNTEWELLVKLCREFVYYFKVTHYVTVIELGVEQYQVKEVTSQVKEKSASKKLALYQNIQAAASISSAWKKFSEDTNTRTLGVIKDDEVERLAVLNFSVLPITDRVKTTYLRLALQKALMEHIEEYYQDVDHQFKSKHTHP